MRTFSIHNIVKFLKPIIYTNKLINSVIPSKNIVNSIIILSYHSISGYRNLKYSHHYSIDPQLFNIHMNYLHDINFNVINLMEFQEMIKAPALIDRQTIVLTFDDGYADSYFYAYPILKKNGFSATFFLISSFIDSKTIFPWLRESLIPRGENLPLSADQILEMTRGGMDFGSHSHSHQRLIKISQKEAFKEIQGSKTYIEDLIGRKINSFSYPYGSWTDFNRSHQEMTKLAGYELAVTSIYGSNTKDSNPFLLKRIPIYGNDSLSAFKMKINGSYDWIGGLQKLFSFFT